MKEGFWAHVRKDVAAGSTRAKAVSVHAPVLASAKSLVESLNQVDATIAGPGLDIMGLLNDPAVSDVLINGTQVWVDRAGNLTRTGLELGSLAVARELAVRMAAAAGVRLDEAMPIVDGTLPDGTRLHAVLSPPAVGGPLISLRTKRKVTFTLDQLEENGTLTAQIRAAIEYLIRSRASVLLSGATGTGKTTLLSAILSAVDPSQRIMCIEEVPELNPTHPHVVSLCRREANVQGEGEVSLTDLVRAAMRMRPDRLVVGECRGAEVRDMLTAFNTGHEGGWATIHANAAGDVPVRLVALGALAGMNEATIHAHAVAALDAIIHVGRHADGRRQVTEIALVDPGLPFAVTTALTPTGKGLAYPRLQAAMNQEDTSGWLASRAAV